MKRVRSRNKRTTYVLQVTCEKLPDMNEAEFLREVRTRLHDCNGYHVKENSDIALAGALPKVSVLKRIEEFLPAAGKEQP